MIDVVFLLLIFFVCASVGQIREAVLATELSAGAVSAAEAEEQEKKFGEVWVRLIRENEGRTVVEINDRRYEKREQVKQTLIQLAELASEIPVILDIAPTVPLGDVIDVYDTCRAADFESIHFAAAAKPVGKKKRPTTPAK